MITQRRQTITITMSLIRDKRRTNAIKSYRKKEQWANVCKSCGFRFIHGFYVSVSIQKYLKGSLQPKLKGASVWPFNTHSKVPTGWICHKGKLQRLYNDAGFLYLLDFSSLHDPPGWASSLRRPNPVSKNCPRYHCSWHWSTFSLQYWYNDHIWQIQPVGPLLRALKGQTLAPFNLGWRLPFRMFRIETDV